jgi:hypothetical protein
VANDNLEKEGNCILVYVKTYFGKSARSRKFLWYPNGMLDVSGVKKRTECGLWS